MQYPQYRKMTLIAFALITALVLASCKGGGTGDSGTLTGIGLSGLVVADHVSVVEPKPGGSPKPQPAPKGIAGLLLGLISPGQLPATSDYFADTTSVYVNERSTESFSMINQILCMVRQTRYDAMTNRGPYLALVDEGLCSTERSNASTAGQQTTNTSSGSNATIYSSWITDSYRTSDTSPQIVRYWITITERGGGTISLIARMTITKSAETAPPYGLFKIDFQMVDPVTMAEFGRGVLVAEKDPTTGEAVLKWASDDPKMSHLEFSSLAKDPSGATGHGTVLTVDSGGVVATAERFDIAYNTDFFRRNDNADGNPANDICLDRKNFSESAWSYGLYNESDGSRFNLNSGFSIKVGNDYGWIGYWGIWLPSGVTLSNGQTVYQHDYQTDTDTPYTVFQAGGKLKRHTKHPLTLADVKNVPLYWWDSVTNAYYTIIWDGSALTKTARQDASGYWQTCNGVLCGTGVLDLGPWNVDLSALYSTDLYFWSQALSGQVRVTLTGCIYTPATNRYDCSVSGLPSASTPVIYYSEDIVYPGDTTVPASLACSDNCPNTMIDGAGGKIDTTTPILLWNSSGTTGYTFDTTAGVLKYNNLAAVQKDSISGYDWGITSGALFDVANLSIPGPLTCDPPYDTQICAWKAGSLNEFYTWETGLNSWNKFTGLIDSSGSMVHFDPPLQVQYTHVQTNPAKPDSKYNGVKFYLEYNGFGSLQGIPGVCIDPNTGATASCGPNTWWVPEFLIPDMQADGTLTEVFYGNPPKPLIVKALQIEQRMVGVPVAACGGLVTTASQLPDMSAYDEPNNGRMPNITSAPKVVGGVIQ